MIHKVFANCMDVLMNRSRRASRSSSIFDVRSLTEEDVTFSRTDSIRFAAQTSGSYVEMRPNTYPEDVPTTSGLSTHQTLPSLSPIPRTAHISEFMVPSQRPYSPDIDALSLALPTSAYASSQYMSSYGRSTAYGRLAHIRRTLNRATSVGDKEETKSVSEKDVYDWKRS
jgi:hypothetical protein